MKGFVWLRKEVEKKAFRAMQSAGVYDPMEQAGYGDVVYVSDVLALIGTVEKELRERLKVEENQEWHVSTDVSFALQELIKEILGE